MESRWAQREKKIITNIRGGAGGGRTENSSRDQSEYGEIPGLNYVNIKRTGVIPEAQYGDHLKNCVVA